MSNPLIKAFRFFIDYDFGKLFNRPDLPLGFRILNYIILVSVLPWPLLLFMSIFLSDAPSNETKASSIFLLVIIYPFLILLFAVASFKAYGTSPVIAYIFPILSAVVIGILIYKFYSF